MTNFVALVQSRLNNRLTEIMYHRGSAGFLTQAERALKPFDAKETLIVVTLAQAYPEGAPLASVVPKSSLYALLSRIRPKLAFLGWPDALASQSSRLGGVYKLSDNWGEAIKSAAITPCKCLQDRLKGVNS